MINKIIISAISRCIVTDVVIHIYGLRTVAIQLD